MTKKKTLFVYNVNPSNDGTHKIHEHICPYTPVNENTVSLDFFYKVDQALEFAQKRYPNFKFDLCDFCCGKEKDDTKERAGAEEKDNTEEKASSKGKSNTKDKSSKKQEK